MYVLVKHPINSKGDPSARLYSRLADMESFRSAKDGNFFFGLAYPEISANKLITWKQTDNPFDVTGRRNLWFECDS